MLSYNIKKEVSLRNFDMFQITYLMGKVGTKTTKKYLLSYHQASIDELKTFEKNK